eukprot:COSAG02_NODE_64953_length_259_cov_0.650000_1_plen_55_part_01
MGIHEDLKNLPGCVALVAHVVILCLQAVALPFALLIAVRLDTILSLPPRPRLYLP